MQASDSGEPKHNVDEHSFRSQPNGGKRGACEARPSAAFLAVAAAMAAAAAAGMSLVCNGVVKHKAVRIVQALCGFLDSALLRALEDVSPRRRHYKPAHLQHGCVPHRSKLQPIRH